MTVLRVAGLQGEIDWEDAAASLRRWEPLLDRAAGDGARLLVLPEMFATGFSMRAEVMATESPRVEEFVSRKARELGVWICAGVVVPGPKRPFNAAILVDSEGREALHYRKVHPFSLAGEHEHYAAGAEVLTVAIDGVRVTPFVCYDLRFPEIFRLAADDTDLFLVIANWPEARRQHWQTLLAARAIENQAYVLGVNRVGEGDGLRYAGDSQLIDPLGEVIAGASWQSGAVMGEVDGGRVVAVRERFGFLSDRREVLYRTLARRRAGRRGLPNAKEIETSIQALTELTSVLRMARDLLARPENDFNRSWWPDAAAALNEVDGYIALLESGNLPDPIVLTGLFLPTANLQEVSMGSGWADEYVSLADLFDRAMRQCERGVSPSPKGNTDER